MAFLRVFLFHYLFFFNDTATPEISTLSLHDALPICRSPERQGLRAPFPPPKPPHPTPIHRSEEHTSELKSRFGISYAVFSLKKKQQHIKHRAYKYTTRAGRCTRM